MEFIRSFINIGWDEDCGHIENTKLYCLFGELNGANIKSIGMHWTYSTDEINKWKQITKMESELKLADLINDDVGNSDITNFIRISTSWLTQYKNIWIMVVPVGGHTEIPGSSGSAPKSFYHHSNPQAAPYELGIPFADKIEFSTYYVNKDNHNNKIWINKSGENSVAEWDFYDTDRLACFEENIACEHQMETTYTE